MGKVATSPLPPRGSPPLQSGGQNQKWPINGQGGYITPAASGIPTASKRGAKSEVAHKWARWLHHPCRLGDPLRFKAGGKWPINGQDGYITLAASGPTLQSGGQNQKWPINGQGVYITLPPRGSPPLQSGGQNQKWPINGQGGYITPAASGIPTASKRGAKSEVAHKWARWLHHPCRLGDPQSGGENQKWLHATSAGIPSASKGAKSEVAHKWARWLHHPCRLGDPHRFKAGGKIRSGP